MSTVEPNVESSTDQRDDQPDAPTAAPPPATGRAKATRLPLVVWLPLTLVRPVRAVDGSDHAGWLLSWAAHLVGLLLGAVMLVVMPWATGTVSHHSPSGFLFGVSVDEILEAMLADTGNLVLAVVSLGMGLLAIHVGTAIAATGLMSWTARGDERVGASWARAMQRLWRLTPFAVTLMVVFGLGTYAVEVFVDAWWPGYYAPWDMEAVFYMGLWLGMMAWTLTATGWALYPGRERARCRWPATCEGCGYALMGLEGEQTCPECGVPMSRSVEASARPGAAWARAEGVGGYVWGWWSCVARAIFMPTRLGRSLHLLVPGCGHRWFFALHLPAVVVSPLPGLLAMMVMVGLLFGEWDNESLLETVWLLLVMTMVIGMWTLGLMVVVYLGGAGVIGGIASWVHGRNLLPAALQGACYLSGYALLWIATVWLYLTAAACAIYVAVEVYGYDWFYGPSWGMVDPFWLAWLGFLGLNGLLLTIYLTLVWRVSRAAKHANW